LQSLVSDYKRIISDYGYVAGDVRSSYVKELLIEEYGETIGFKERSEMNKSAWVYDVAGGGDYIEAAISSSGISDEQLLHLGHLQLKAKRCPFSCDILVYH